MANSVDPDSVASDLDRHCLQRPLFRVNTVKINIAFVSDN